MSFYRSLSNGKSYQLIRGNPIGRGAYGSVGEVQGRSEYVYKDVHLTSQEGDWIVLTRELRIKAIYRELAALKKLNLLEGYIRENDTITLIMRKLEGEPEYRTRPAPHFDPNNIDLPPNILDYGDNPNEETLAARAAVSLKALFELNRKGVYHLDPNSENCLIYQDREGRSHANIIDFGNATEYAYINYVAQLRTFDLTRLQTQALSRETKRIFEEFKAQHRTKTYVKYGFYFIAGVGIVSVCGFNSFLMWQLLRSCLIQKALREVRALLDLQDLQLAKMWDAPQFTNRHLMLRKGLITLGYTLINVFNFINLYYSIPNLKLTTSLKELLDTMRQLDNSSISQVTHNLIQQCILPLIHNILRVLKDPFNYTQVVSGEVLDKALAEMTYLYMQLQTSVEALKNMLERVPPAGHLLIQADLTYKYHPSLLFKFGVTKAKAYFHSDNRNSQEQNTMPVAQYALPRI